MKNFIKNNFTKIIISLSLCLTFVLSFVFIPKTFAQVENENGYIILPNGIQSLNLFNYNDIQREKAFSGFNIIDNPNYFVSGYISVEYGKSYYLNGKSSGYSFVTYDNNKNAIRDASILNGIYTPTQNETYIRFNALLSELYNVMFNEGVVPLKYYPYGFYQGYNSFDWNDNLIKENEMLMQNSSTALYSALNNATAKLYNYQNDTLIMQESISMNKTDISFSTLNIPNIRNYLLHYDSEDTTTYPSGYVYLVIDFNFVVNNSIIFTFNNTNIQYIVTITNTINDYSASFTNQGNTNSLINNYEMVVNTDKIGFNQLKYDSFYMPDYISFDFNITFDGYAYSQGYKNGVDSQQTTLSIERNNAKHYKDLYEESELTISNLTQRVNDLQEQVNSNFGFKNIFFAMADTPFKTVSNFLGFDLFGINLFQAFIGFITVLACIWLIKKLI